MTRNIINALIEKNAFDGTTIITASYQSVDLFGRVFNKQGEFRIRRILKSDDVPLLELIDLTGNKTVVKANPESIKAVDGMEVSRYADIYDILPDGSKKRTGRKRGRKPKAQSLSA